MNKEKQFSFILFHDFELLIINEIVNKINCIFEKNYSL